MRQVWTRALRLRWLFVVAVTSLITLAASSPIYSAARGGHVTAGSTAATADCSKAAATEIVLRLHLNDPEVADPVGKVLCGSFTGPGSETMVVSLWGPGNTGLIAFAVFRWAGGAWQFLMKQPAAASITAAGSDIRQTLPIYRASDRRCCPTGGTKTRIWHWDGMRFTAGPWKQVIPPVPTTSGYFKTPSGNIACDYQTLRPPYVRCGIRSGLKPPPPPKRPGCSRTNRISLGGSGRARLGTSICPGDDEGDAGPFAGKGVAQVLDYGKAWSGGGLRCTSAFKGLTCRNRSGHGFFLSRARWRRF